MIEKVMSSAKLFSAIFFAMLSMHAFFYGDYFRGPWNAMVSLLFCWLFVNHEKEDT